MPAACGPSARRSGDLTWFDGTDRDVRRSAVERPSDAELVVVDGAPAVVERGQRRVRAVAHGGGFGAESCLEIDPADRSVRVGGSGASDRLYVVSGDQGTLRVSDLRTGECAEVVVGLTEPGADLGIPREAQGRVFVPDYSTGTVVVVDLEARRAAHTTPLMTPGVEFELIDHDGIVFYNDPGSERAGVVRIDASFSVVAKYDPDDPGAGTGPDDEGDGDGVGAGEGEGARDAAEESRGRRRRGRRGRNRPAGWRRCRVHPARPRSRRRRAGRPRRGRPGRRRRPAGRRG